MIVSALTKHGALSFELLKTAEEGWLTVIICVFGSRVYLNFFVFFFFSMWIKIKILNAQYQKIEH